MQRLRRPMSEPMTGALGLLGGTFDPLHIGHLRLALEAREALGLAEVRLIPAGTPPLRAVPQCAAVHRLAMAESAVVNWIAESEIPCPNDVVARSII